MITINIIGLDPFTVGHYSKEHTSDIANLFEIPDDGVSFAATDNVLIHAGVEQTSWNAIITVNAPERFRVFEKAVASYLLETLAPFAIHLECVFSYFGDHAHYEKINEMYPRWIRADQVKEVTLGEDEEETEEEDLEEVDPGDRAELDREDPSQIFTGNAFEGFEERLAAAMADKEDK